MNNYHHRPIRKFNLSGIIQDDASIPRLRDEYTRLVLSEMRLSGYVPRLDIDEDFTIDYNDRRSTFEFELTIYGVYTGRRKSEWIVGIDKAQAVYIAQSKSKEYLQEQV
jgi:hypothetical protein